MKSISVNFLAVLFIITILSVTSLATAQDDFEDDNTYEQARKVVLNLETPQSRTLHTATDQDWIKFYGFQEKTYAIKAVNKGPGDLMLKLYDANDMSAPIKTQDNPLDPLADEILSSGNALVHDGIYYVKISLSVPGPSNDNTAYDLTAYIPEAGQERKIHGVVTNAVDGSFIGDAIITTDQLQSDLSDPSDGSYELLNHPEGIFQLFARRATDDTLQKGKYLTCLFSDNLQSEIKEINIGMIPLDLAGALLVLQLLSENSPNHLISWEQDIDGDQKIGLAEGLYILRNVAELP